MNNSAGNEGKEPTIITVFRKVNDLADYRLRRGALQLARGTPRHNLAKGYLAIINQLCEFQLSSADPERDMLDFLSKPHSDPNLTKAVKEVLEQIGEVPAS